MRSPKTYERDREPFARRRMRHRHPIPIATLVLMVAACDITQEHIDEASDRLADATVAAGSPPTAAQIAAAVPLRREHLAGSAWRLIELQRMSGMPNSAGWPHAMAVISLGSNGKVVWHMSVHSDLERDRTHWGVSADHQFYLGWGGGIITQFAGRTVNANTVCLGDPCQGVLQRVTP